MGNCASDLCMHFVLPLPYLEKDSSGSSAVRSDYTEYRSTESGSGTSIPTVHNQSVDQVKWAHVGYVSITLSNVKYEVSL